MTPLPSQALRAQAKFARTLIKRGRGLTFTYAGPPARSPMNGFVTAPPMGTDSERGILGFRGVTSDLVREFTRKWGDSFIPDGFLLFPVSVGSANLSTVTDLSPGGETYDVIAVLPDSMAENACRIACVRRLPVYNRLVTVRLQDDVIDGGAGGLVMANLPCRLTPQDAAGLDQGGDMGATLSAPLWLECPFVTAGAGVLGAGVQDAGPAGTRIYLTPKQTVVVDDPAAYGQTGPVLTYRVDSVNIDRGGDGHHATYLVSRA